MIGNVLEWYDFAIYGFFAVAIGRQFFPNESPLAQLLATFGIFAIGFLVRPLGGIVIGHVSDHFGRRTALVVSITAMAIPTFLIGLLPGYETLGMLAPIALVVLRMMQGLSLGGEYPSSMVFLVEHAPPGKRGLVGGFAALGAVLGLLLGSATGAVLALMMSPEALDAWGWRIPFLMGLFVGFVGHLLRRHIVETVPERHSQRPAIVETLRDHWRLVLRIAGASTFTAVPFQILFVYLVSAMQIDNGFTPAEALVINSVSMMMVLPSMLVGAGLSDRFGRRPVLLATTAIGFVAAWPIFMLLHHADPWAVLAGQMAAATFIGAFNASLPALLVEAAPARVRCTAVALGFNLSIGIVGGLTPFAATLMVERSGSHMAPALLIMAAALVAFISVLRFRETYRSPLHGSVVAKGDDTSAAVQPAYAMMSGRS
jgi:MHS family proline/betaine transporter-like MFS transporter